MIEEKYVIEKYNPLDIVVSLEKASVYFKSGIGKYSDEEYLYWDEIRYKKVPKEFTSSEELWAMIKIMRNLIYYSPIKTEKGENFKFGELPFSKKLLHEIDKNAGGFFFGNLTANEKKLFMTNGILEEAISSSQLEGASTTMKVAKDMIKRKRKPRNKDEQMIYNNFEAINYIKNTLIKKELELSDILYLQSVLTRHTLKNPEDSGRLRMKGEEIFVTFENKISHTPPSINFVEKQLKVLLDFANDRGDFNFFVHPVIKAILLHFWIGYLHPFCDGNGRTARALFYWYLLKNDYYGFIYIPVSKIIKKSKKAYAKSYIYSEQDALDLNYFISYNLSVIKKAFDDFELNRITKVKENRVNMKKFAFLKLNERQGRLINHFLEEPDSYTNIITHQSYYGITRYIAIQDLKDLEKKGLLFSVKVGRVQNYFPVDDLEDIINDL